jgi:hypothetical protein
MHVSGDGLASVDTATEPMPWMSMVIDAKIL